MIVEIWTATVQSPDSKEPLTVAAADQKALGEILKENYTDETDAPPAWHSVTLGIAPLVEYLERTQNLTITWDSHHVEVPLPKVDPTALVEHVGKAIYDFHLAEAHGPWEAWSATDKQSFKQGIVNDLYLVLNALADQGVIGGIAHG